jgi:hypothetical protein
MSHGTQENRVLKKHNIITFLSEKVLRLGREGFEPSKAMQTDLQNDYLTFLSFLPLSYLSKYYTDT